MSELTTQEEVLNIKDFNIKIGTIFQVAPKYDGNAPDGFRKARTTKFLTTAGMNREAIPFNTFKNVWDTGLYKGSPVFEGMDSNEVEELVEKLERLIVEPLEERLGEGRLSYKETNNYWDDYGIDLYRGKIFNTSKPEELLALYEAIIHGKLCPMGQESSPFYKSAQFCVEDKEEALSVKHKEDLLDIKATGLFHTLATKEPKKLQLALNYVGVRGIDSKNFKEEVAASAFKIFIDHKDDGYANKNMFIEAASMANTKQGYNILYYYKILQDLFRKKKITKEFENYKINDENLGTSLKQAAEIVAKKQDLQTEVLALAGK